MNYRLLIASWCFNCSEDFTEYANVCFQEFGDRVKYWITFNEPNVPGYGFTCSSPFDDDCLKQYGDAETYTAVHNVLQSHAAAVHLYRTKYQVLNVNPSL